MAIVFSDNSCVCCGEAIPEGSQACPKCLKTYPNSKKQYCTGKYALRNTITMAFVLEKMGKPKTFINRSAAWDFIKAARLNPKCYEVVKLK